jgi:hypothetical protein
VVAAIPIDACDVADAIPGSPQLARAANGGTWRRIEWAGVVGWVFDDHLRAA